jgi:hypothetical protein
VQVFARSWSPRGVLLVFIGAYVLLRVNRAIFF